MEDMKIERRERRGTIRYKLEKRKKKKKKIKIHQFKIK